MSVDVNLTPDELVLAADIARGRMISATAAAREPNWQAAPRGWGEEWEAHLIGIAGEIAVARYLGRYWPATTTYRKGDADLPPDVEVRTARRSDGSLIMHAADQLDRWFVLVVVLGYDGPMPRALRIVGSIRGRDVEGHDEWVRDPLKSGRPAWFVPQSALHPIRPKAEAVR